MRWGASIRTTGILLGALLALGVPGRGSQGHQSSLPEPSENIQQKSGQPAKISDGDRADILMARKSYDAAILYYTRAIKTHPVSEQSRAEIAGLWNKLGICYQQKMEYGEAREAYKHALRLKKDYAQAWNNLGTTFYLTHKPKKSIKFYRHAIKLSPMSASFHFNLATAYFVRKKYEKSIGEYRTAIQIDPEILRQNSSGGTAVETRHADARFYFYMAKIFASVGNTTEAIRYLQHAMEEGFNNRDRILHDPDIKKISKDPAFIALMKNPPVAIKD